MVTNWYEYPNNFSNGTIVNSPGTLFQYSDYLLNSWFAEGILGFIFLFSFSISIMAGAKRALLTSSFITFVFAVYFARLDMISPIWIFALIVAIIIGAIGSKEERGL